MAGKKGPIAKYPLEKQNPPVTYYWGPEIDRETARSLGRIRYFTGDACIWGHVEERWVSSGTCIQCRLQRNRTPEYREYAAPVLASWSKANPEKVEGYNLQRRNRRAADPIVANDKRASCRAWYDMKKQDPEWVAAERKRLRDYKRAKRAASKTE